MELRRRISAWSLERERIETSLERERERGRSKGFQVLGLGKDQKSTIEMHLTKPKSV